MDKLKLKGIREAQEIAEATFRALSEEMEYRFNVQCLLAKSTLGELDDLGNFILRCRKNRGAK